MQNLEPGTAVEVRTYSRWGPRAYRATVVMMVPAGTAIEEVLPADRAYPRGVRSRVKRWRVLVVTKENEVKAPVLGMVRKI